MTINATEKVINAIEDNVKDLSFNFYKTEDLKNANEYLKQFKYSKEKSSLVAASKILLEAREYENGFKLITYRQYYDKSKISNGPINVVILTKGNKLLVEFCTEEEEKPIGQFLLATIPNIETLNKLSRILKCTKTSFAYGCSGMESMQQSVVTTIKDISVDEIIYEKYRQYHPLTDSRLFTYCGCGVRNLEIIYKNEQPIYCQLSNKYSVEMAGFNPNDPIDAETCVSYVNNEFDEFISLINKAFNKGSKQAKKIIKKTK